MAKTSNKKPNTEMNSIETPTVKPTVHNRLRAEKNPSDDPVRKKRQDRYYATQETILANKAQYRKDVKEGKRIVIPKNLKGKKLTEAQKKKINKAQKRKHYKTNKKTILAKQSENNRQKAHENKIIKAQNATDAFNKLNGW